MMLTTLHDPTMLMMMRYVPSNTHSPFLIIANQMPPLEPRKHFDRVMRQVLNHPEYCHCMLGLKKYEFEQLVDILPKFKALNKSGMKMGFSVNNEAKQLIGNRG